MKHWLTLGLLMVALSGCRSLPFAPIAPAPMAACDPVEVRTRFAQALPERFQLVTSVVFEYRWRQLTALGYIAGDRSAPSFAAVGLTPLGVKLFEVAERNGRIEAHFIVEDFKRREEFVRAIGDDLRNIYFDLVPPPDAAVRKEEYALIYTRPRTDGRVEYEFGGADGVLTAKRYYAGRRLVSEIAYYDYRRQDGRLYPGGLILENHQYSYRLIVRLKTIGEAGIP